MNYYTTKGSVRGGCGHKHRTLLSAHRCARRDQSGCTYMGGYSDRRIVHVLDGEEQELTDSEREQIWDFCDENI